MAAKRNTFDRALDELRQACANPNQINLSVLRRILNTRSHPFLIKEAAELTTEHNLRELIPDLEMSLDVLLDSAPKSDPGCQAKRAIINTLAHMIAGRSNLLQRACYHVQMEPAGPGITDTAGELRVTALEALLLQNDSDAMNIAACLLHDSEPAVRASTARVLGALAPAGADTLLRSCALSGESDQEVLVSLLTAILRMTPTAGLPFVTWFLFGEQKPSAPDYRGFPRFLGEMHDRRDQEYLPYAAVLALGEARPQGAKDLLVQKLEQTFDMPLVHHLLLGLALLRESSATEILLNEIKDAPTARAEGALTALALFRHDESLKIRIEQILGERKQPSLNKQFAKEFRRTE